MRIETLRVERFRCLRSVDLRLGAGLNVFVGENGSGKTSVLEAAHVLSYGRSFRSGPRDALVMRGEESASVFATVESKSRQRRLGFERSRGGWRARVDEVEVRQLGDLLHECRVLCFEPGSHDLVSGPGEVRRRILDWVLFHVEHDFVSVWRRYERALAQRNRLLRSAASDPEIRHWNEVLGECGSRLDELRSLWAAELAERFSANAKVLLPELGAGSLRYRRGWSSDFECLRDALDQSWDRDRDLGYTHSGPHRADLVMSFEADLGRHHLSRGQEKVAALCLMLSQSDLLSEALDGHAVLCLDDLFSELDEGHARTAVRSVMERGAQVLLTGVSIPAWVQDEAPATTMFHVKQGGIALEAAQR